MMIVFPSVATVVAFVAVYFRVQAGVSPALYVIPPLAGALTFLGMRRVFVDPKGPPATLHQYTLHAPSSAGVTLGTLLARLEQHGYQPDAHTLDAEEQIGARPGHALELQGSELRIVDRRAPEVLGRVVLRLRAADDGSLFGLIEALDTGAGVYDELAQFAIVALAGVIPGLEVALPAKGPASRRPAAALAAELPEKPFGVGML